MFHMYNWQLYKVSGETEMYCRLKRSVTICDCWSESKLLQKYCFDIEAAKQKQIL